MAPLSLVRYRPVGVLLTIAGFLCLWAASCEGLINVYRIILPGHTLPDGSYPYPANFRGVNAVFGIVSACMLTVGAAMVFLAKEPDEYFYKVRLESIQFAVFVQFLVGLIAFAYFYFTPGYQMENTFQAILGLACGAFLVAYPVRYYTGIHFKADQD
ncbi:MAG: hypothetical protein J7619_00775 [Dyadobacter sp.]|uniref:hypothetical protein n=1 Tax=Dyadobacter sp. TaxID=1914288 RepID=UPI001B24AC97|nr:hypothetical protein [Dyadobacter sp.]MBO9611190.1 hypothetical protein [Dyadobacter sp.]